MAGRLRPVSGLKADFTATVSWVALCCTVLLAGCQTNQEPKADPAQTAASLATAQVQAAKQAEAAYNYSDALGIYQTLYSQHPDDLDLGMSVARNLRFTGQANAEIALVNHLMTQGGR